jgi:hypothetical protein
MVIGVIALVLRCFIFPPEKEYFSPPYSSGSYGGTEVRRYYNVDSTRILAESAIIVLSTGVLVLVFQKKKKKIEDKPD